MQYFDSFVSNTVAAGGNQLYFTMEETEVRTGRVFYKVFAAGEYSYSLLFSNIMDSTFADGSVSHKNLICGSWKIHSARIGRCSVFETQKELSQLVMTDDANSDIVVSDFQQLSFNGNPSKTVMPGEFFSSDPLNLSFRENEYLCFEITFSGKMIPYHQETLLPVFVKEQGAWHYSQLLPLPGMIGCDRPVSAKVGFLGDSITQGIGPGFHTYLYWSALLPDKIGSKYAYWNLGLGYARANDAASDGAWLYKAKQNDILFVCFGVNDLYQGFSEAQIKADLTAIVDALKKQKVKVILQTIPPFDYPDELIEIWKRINQYIKEVLREKVDYVFDIVPHLSESEARSHMAKYNGHPNAEGSAIWAEALYQEVKHLF